jgi:chemotaxis signal transduction protein
MSATSTAASRAAKLRLAFDQAFAAPIHLEGKSREQLLAVRVAAQALAIRLSEISGLHVDKKITPVPGGHAALLGIAGFRGAILPVYDLRTMLGHPTGERPRWLVIAAAAPVALAFDTFDGQLRVPHDAIVPQAAGPEVRGYARKFVGSRKFVGPLLHLPSVLEAIDREARRKQ